MGNLYFLCPFSGRIFILLRQEQQHLASTLFFLLGGVIGIQWIMQARSRAILLKCSPYVNLLKCFMSILSLLRDCVCSSFLPLEMTDKISPFFGRSTLLSLFYLMWGGDFCVTFFQSLGCWRGGGSLLLFFSLPLLVANM